MLAKINEKFILGGTIGSGGQAEVKLGTCKPGVKPGGRVAIKIAKISHSNPRALMDKEIALLDHIESNDPEGTVDVVRFYGKIEDSQHVVLILELCSGGELFDDILDNGTYSEYQASRSMNAIARTLSSMQQMGIIHRDIKPENFVYSDKSDNRKLKLIDFGMACRTTDPYAVRASAIGTPAYQAPEIICEHGEATTASDIWSLGVVLFIMLSGTFPFNPNNGDDKLRRQIQSGTFSFNPHEWKHVSADAKDLIRKMLTVDVEKRITLAEILLHPWLTKQQQKQPFESEYFSRLRSAKAVHELRGAVTAMITAKKWMRKSLKNSAKAARDAGMENPIKLKAVDESAQEQNMSVDIPVADLRNMQKQFEEAMKRNVNHDDDDDAVSFHTFATVVSSVKSCHIFCSLHFYQMFDTANCECMSYKKFLASLATLREVIDDEWVSFCFQLFDQSGDMRISRKEFCYLAPSFSGPQHTSKRSDVAAQMLHLVTPAGGGHQTTLPPQPPTRTNTGISVDELGFDLVDYEDDNKAMLHESFNAVDLAGNGWIDFREFKAWLISLHGKGNCT